MILRAPHTHERLRRVQRNGHEPAAKPGSNEHGPSHTVRFERRQPRRRKSTVLNPATLGRRSNHTVHVAHGQTGLLSQLTLRERVVFGLLKRREDEILLVLVLIHCDPFRCVAVRCGPLRSVSTSSPAKSIP